MNVAARAESADAEAMPAFVDLGWDAEDRDDTWLISYADIVSTALAMVVLLFGRAALAPGAPVAPEPAPTAVAAVATEQAPLQEASQQPADEAAGLDAVTASAEALERIEAAAETRAPAASDAADAAPASEPRPDERLAALVTARFAGRIAAERHDEGVVLTIPAVALFDSSRDDLSPAALPLLNDLAATLREVGEARISVEGHTDDRPVQGGAFRSNWDLAAARANAVTRFFLAQGFAPERLHSVSYADTRPVADNTSPEGRAANRRVELAIDFEPPRR